jgi:superfamily II DNA or RNA helicase
MQRKTRLKPAARREPLVPYHRQPEGMSLEDWQKALRRQFVAGKQFEIAKLPGHPVFCDYTVRNPENGNSYRVSIRDKAGERNFCECLDFKTNRLGTCKHIEAVIRQIEGKRALKKAFREGHTPPYTSVFLAYGDEHRVKIRIGQEKAEEFAALAAVFFDGDGCLKPSAFGRFDEFLKQASALDDGFRCYDDALSFVLEARGRKLRIAQIERKYAESGSFAGLLKTELYEYQRQGILFAAKAGRAMIADEMGLGKTVQAIGAAILLRREAGVRKVLIVCPTSLKYQWRSEIERFSGDDALVIEGGPLAREKLYRREVFFTIVSYHTVGNDLEAIGAMEPDLVILDEAQRIKNWKTKLARNVKKVSSPYAIVLTGTPLENNLEELYSIVQFIDPYKLGPYRAFLSAHERRDDRGKLTGYAGLHEVGASLSDIAIRRRKKEVLAQLPERIDERRFVPMTEKQRRVHEEYVDSVARLVNRWRKQGFLSEVDRQKLLIFMNCMRMVCDSTYILDQDEANRHDTKIDELLCLLEEALEDPESKVVVFSQWERMTRLVAMELEARGIGFEHLHGGVPSAKRKDLFDRFNGDMFCRVFLSTDAGSTGLNLQSASTLVNLDLPWNPAVLEQRIARIHRIGQKRSVHIVNFVSADTIESRMLSVLGFKADLAGGILDGGEDSIFMADEKYGRFMDAVEKLAVPAAPAAPTAGEEDESEESEGEELEREELDGSEIEGADDGADDGAELENSEIQEQVEAESAAELGIAEGGVASMGESPDGEPQESDIADRALSFLGDLSRVLANPESTRRFVSGLVAKEEGSGKTYLKIPVKDEDTALAAFAALGKLFSALGQGSGSSK